MQTHRLIQVYMLNDRASSERVRYYCNAIKAVAIGNQTAARYFTRRAQKWESIRQRSQRMLIGARGEVQS